MQGSGLWAQLAGAAAVVALIALAAPGQVMAWGSTGHRLIGRAALETLPSDTPAFLRSAQAIEAVGELSREPDRWKGAGKAHDADLDPAHFLDLGDNGRIFGGPALAALPATRAQYERALRRVGSDGWRAGYLPYSIIEGWQQLAMDLGYWRVDEAGARLSPDPGHRAWLAADGQRREALTLRDLGVLSHYVGDGSQPLHVTVHFNGWGPYPNPDGFTQDPVHGPFEGAFVRAFVTAAMVRSGIGPSRILNGPIEAETAAYLAATQARVAPFYRLYKAGGFAPGDRRGAAFAAARLAAGAAELRDMIASAWQASAASQVGWPAIGVADVEAGRLDPFDSLHGGD